MQLNASLDTSFWNIAAKVGVTSYLFSFFRIYYTQAVEREIITTDADETPLIYPQAMLFTVLREDGRLHQVEPEKPLSLYGSGEAYAIALAREMSWVLLINDARPLAFAEAMGIQCVSVPDFCVLLYSQGKITYAAVRGYLRRLSSTTSPALIQRVNRVINEIATKRGDVT